MGTRWSGHENSGNRGSNLDPIRFSGCLNSGFFKQVPYVNFATTTSLSLYSYSVLSTKAALSEAEILWLLPRSQRNSFLIAATLNRKQEVAGY